MIEGIAEIELTDVNTGRKEIVTEKNMVTNALKYIYETRTVTGPILRNLLPMFKKSLGGVLLFDDNIEEDPENIIPPAICNCVGHAGADSYAGLNERRGSFNPTESGMLDNGMKLVWDFTTNQANGTIKCLSLTSHVGGQAGLGHNSSAAENSTPFVDIENLSDRSERLDIDRRYSFVVENYVLKISIFSNPYSYFSITHDYTRTSLLEKIIEIPLDSQYGTRCSHDKCGDFLYFLQCGSSKKASVIKYNIKTEVHEVKEIEDGFTINADKHFVIGDYLLARYYIGGDKYRFRIYNINNKADIKEVYIEDGSYHARAGNRVYSANRIIDVEGNVLSGGHGGDRSVFFKESFNKLFYMRDAGGYTYDSVYAPYLATINNLAVPVIKTADKTMKITYTVREATDPEPA